MKKTCPIDGTTNHVQTGAATRGGPGERQLQTRRESPFPAEHTLLRKRNHQGRGEGAAARPGRAAGRCLP